MTFCVQDSINHMFEFKYRTEKSKNSLEIKLFFYPKNGVE